MAQQPYPPRKRKLLPWLLAGGGLVIVAVAVILVVVLTNGPDTSSADGVAEAAVAAYDDKDVDALTEVSCAGAKDLAKNLMDQAVPAPVASVELNAVRVDGDEAVAAFSVTYSDTEGTVRKSTMDLAKENGEWCVAWIGS